MLQAAQDYNQPSRLTQPERIAFACTPAKPLPGPCAGRSALEKKPASVNLRVFQHWRPMSESNRRTRICNPLHNHSATQPFEVTYNTKKKLKYKGRLRVF